MDAEAAAKQYYESNLGFGLGAQFMAVVFDTLFAGVLICQLTHWLPNLKHDLLRTRIIAGFGAAAAIATTMFTWSNYMSSFVYQFGHFSRFASFQDLGWYAFLDILTVIPVQLIFADRSIKVNNKNPIVILLDALLILGTLGSALSVVAVTRGHTMFDATKAMRICLLLWPSICTCTHIVLTSTIVFGLWKYRQGLTTSTSVVDRLIYTSLESQLPATCFAFATMITLAADPKSPIVPWIIIVHPKVFIIGCLAMLNSRHTWQRQGKLPSSGQLSSRSKASNASSDESAEPRTPQFNLMQLGLDRNDNAKHAKSADIEGGMGLSMGMSAAGGYGTGHPMGLGVQFHEQQISAIDPHGRHEYTRSDSNLKM